MVTVPPMNESYQMVSEEAWVELSEVDCLSYDTIVRKSVSLSLLSLLRKKVATLL